MQVDYKVVKQNPPRPLESAFLNRDQTRPRNAIQHFETTAHEEQV